MKNIKEEIKSKISKFKLQNAKAYNKKGDDLLQCGHENIDD